MERIVNLFHKNGISAFSMLGQDKDLVYSCAGKVILLHTSSNKEEIGYIIKEGEILMESGRIVDMDGIYLPEFIQEEGVWLNHCNDDSNTIPTWLRLSLLRRSYPCIVNRPRPTRYCSNVTLQYKVSKL